MEDSITKISLMVEGNGGLDLNMVTKLLKSIPTYMFRVGDETEYGISKRNIWQKDYPTFNSYLILDRIKDIKNELISEKENINLLIRYGGGLSLNIVTYMNREDDVGIDLDIELIKFLNDFQISLHYNVYDLNYSPF